MIGACKRAYQEDLNNQKKTCFKSCLFTFKTSKGLPTIIPAAPPIQPVYADSLKV
jgi:hypothetical protein